MKRRCRWRGADIVKKAFAKKSIGALSPLLTEMDNALQLVLVEGTCAKWMVTKVESLHKQVKDATDFFTTVLQAPASKQIRFKEEFSQASMDKLVKAGNNSVGAVNSAVDNHEKLK